MLTTTNNRTPPRMDEPELTEGDSESLEDTDMQDNRTPTPTPTCTSAEREELGMCRQESVYKGELPSPALQMELPLYLTISTSSLDPDSDPRPWQIHLANLAIAHFAWHIHLLLKFSIATDPKMAAEFHFFPFLPWELRNQIWKLAIRPALPGAHVFRVSNTNASEQNGPDHETSDDDSLLISSSTSISRLAAPQCLPKGVDFSPAAQAAAPISWALNNPSTYLIDSGLWTACKESLLVIEKEFQVRARREKGWSLSEVESFQKKRGRFTLPETVTHAVCHGSKRRYLTVFPCQDLIILQSLDVTAFHWDVAWNSFPNYDFDFDLEHWYRIAYWDEPDRHIAMEYDPAWDTDRSLIFGIVLKTASADPFYLWFIDYRIKRNPRYQEPTKEQATGRKDPTVFYASDRRYVEVEDNQLGAGANHDCMWDAGYEVPIEGGSKEFVHELKCELVDEYCHPYLYDWEAPYDLDWVKYRLLACEYL
jgi:hypothetical protein